MFEQFNTIQKKIYIENSIKKMLIEIFVWKIQHFINKQKYYYFDKLIKKISA